MMNTFFKINKEPKVGTLCCNPTSRLKGVVLGFEQNYRKENLVVILNERMNTQKINYEVFCERYFYMGESKEKITTLFKVDAEKKSKSLKVGEVCLNNYSGYSAVISDMFEVEGVNKVKFLNEFGNKQVMDKSLFEQKFNPIGESCVSLKKVFKPLSNLKVLVLKLLTKEFRGKDMVKEQCVKTR